jgi:hypothetical protein
MKEGSGPQHGLADGMVRRGPPWSRRARNRVSPPSADSSSKATPSVPRPLLLRSHQLGRHFFVRAIRGRPWPETGLVKQLKSRDMEVDPSGMGRSDGNYDTHLAYWRAGCNSHPPPQHVKQTDRDESRTTNVCR